MDFFKRILRTKGSATTEVKKTSKSKVENGTEEEQNNKEFSAPYDTRRKLSISRSGRMKQNLKVRGTLGNDLYGDKSRVEKTNIEYHVHGKKYLNDTGSQDFLQKVNNSESNEATEIIDNVNISKANGRKGSKRKSTATNSSTDDLSDVNTQIDKAFKIDETSF